MVIVTIAISMKRSRVGKLGLGSEFRSDRRRATQSRLVEKPYKANRTRIDLTARRKRGGRSGVGLANQE